MFLSIRTLHLLALAGCLVVSCGGSRGYAGAGEDAGDPILGWAAVGRGTTGGAGGAVVVVSTPEGFVSHIGRIEPLIILVRGTVDLSGDFPGAKANHRYEIASNKTIVGIGADAVICHGELRLAGVRNVVIRNLTFCHSPWAAIKVVHRSSHVWIDHNDFTAAADGALDITGRADRVTVSWNRFFGQDKVSLVGAGDDHMDDRGYLRVTYHHNWFRNTNQRHPRVRYGKVHVFNNLFDGVAVGIGIGVEAQIISECNIFDTSTPFHSYDEDNPDRPGHMRDTGSVFMAARMALLDTGGIDWSPDDYYHYKLDAISEVASAVKTGAGVGVIEAPPSPAPRKPAGVIAWYPLTEQRGARATDQSGFGTPLDLTLSGEVSWLDRSQGVSLPGGPAMLQSDGAATKLYDRITTTRQFSVEVWAGPAALNQMGPARLVSYSRGVLHLNFTFAHGSTKGTDRDLVVRMRTTGRGDDQGLPNMIVKDAAINGISYYVCTWDGRTIHVYRNGDLLYREPREGFLEGWDPEYPLILGNETSGDRGWRGDLYEVTIHDRRLSDKEVRERFDATKDRFGIGATNNYSNWLTYSFPELDLTDPEQAGPGADPDGRGIPILLRYIMGSDPLAPTRDRLPRVSLMRDPDSGQERLTLVYRRLTSRTDAEVLVEASGDLVNWTLLGGEQIASVVTDGKLETVTIRDPIPSGAASRRFMRVRAALRAGD